MNETAVDKRLLEEKFYANKFFMSYSALNKLVYAPQLFYKHYVLRQRDDETTPALLQGKVIHCLLLDNGSFDKQFLLLPGNMPSDNPKKVVDKIFTHYLENPPAEGEVNLPPNLADYKDKILEILKEINLHQSLKTDEQRLEKILTDANKEYFQFLLKREGKDIIDIPTLEYCTEVTELLKQHPEVNDLLGISADAETVQVFNEIPIRAEIEGYSFGVKGILDNVKVDFEQKLILINDIKTTSKSLTDFKETIEFWNLWMQAALYDIMVRHEFLRSNGINESEWRIEFTFIVVDKYRQVYPFHVSPETMQQWKEKLDGKLKEAEWHYTSRRYDLPYELATNQVLL